MRVMYIILFLVVVFISGCSAQAIEGAEDQKFLGRYCSEIDGNAIEQYQNQDGSTTAYKVRCEGDTKCISGFCQNMDNLGFIGYDYCSKLDSQYKVSMHQDGWKKEDMTIYRTKCDNTCVLGRCY